MRMAPAERVTTRVTDWSRPVSGARNTSDRRQNEARLAKTARMAHAPHAHRKLYVAIVEAFRKRYRIQRCAGTTVDQRAVCYGASGMAVRGEGAGRYSRAGTDVAFLARTASQAIRPTAAMPTPLRAWLYAPAKAFADTIWPDICTTGTSCSYC